MRLGETIFGVTVWAVLPSRKRGQQTGLAHLTWAGPGDAIHLHAGGITDGHMEHYGRDSGPVSGLCHTEAGAQQAADAYLAGLTQELAAGNTHGPAAPGFPDPSQPRTAAEATGATGVLAAEYPEDETARILAEYGTPEKQLQYALWEATRLRRDAYQTAGKHLDADGSTAAARQRHDVAYEAAHARWAAEAATAVAWYAHEIGPAAPAASSDTGDDTSPYNHGWSSGNRLLTADITRRPGGYDDNQWREYVAGYAEGARLHAKATILYAEAVREQVQRNPAEPVPQTASPGHAALAQDAPGRAPERDRSAALAAEPAGDQDGRTPAGHWTPDMAIEPVAHLDPLSQEYARDYDNGWRASERYLLSDSYQVLTPLERADQRNASHAWYDGYHDHAADRPKWTYRHARQAGFDSAEDYLTARETGAADWQADLPGGPSNDVPDHAVAGPHSADPASPYVAGPDNPAGQQQHDALDAYRAGQSVPGLKLPGNGTTPPAAGPAVAAPDVPGAAPGRVRSAAPRLVAGLGFTGAPGAPLPARPGRPSRRPAGATLSPATQARPRRRQ